jgi:hypothetical protein
MRIVLVVLIATVLNGCGGGSEASPDDALDSDASQVERSDQELILDAVLQDLLTNPRLDHTRAFYGTPGDTKIALVTNASYGVPWPLTYWPILPGWTISRVMEGSPRKHEEPRLLGIRIDRFSIDDDKPPDSRSPVEVTVLNAGGNNNGAIVIGGCHVYYRPKQVGHKWVVRFEGSLDP